MNHPAFLKGISVAASLGMAAALGLAALLGISFAASAASLSTANLSSSKLNSADRTFLINAARTDMIEAHKGQMAESQAGRSDVKTLGKRLPTTIRTPTSSFRHSRPNTASKFRRALMRHGIGRSRC